MVVYVAAGKIDDFLAERLLLSADPSTALPARKLGALERTALRPHLRMRIARPRLA
jgi:hypothetical protein